MCLIMDGPPDGLTDSVMWGKEEDKLRTKVLTPWARRLSPRKLEEGVGAFGGILGETREETGSDRVGGRGEEVQGQLLLCSSGEMVHEGLQGGGGGVL